MCVAKRPATFKIINRRLLHLNSVNKERCHSLVLIPMDFSTIKNLFKNELSHTKILALLQNRLFSYGMTNISILCISLKICEIDIRFTRSHTCNIVIVLFQIKKQNNPLLSLYGQLLWREFFYTAATNNANFDRMKGNPVCVQIPWDSQPEALAKWAEVRKTTCDIFRNYSYL